MKPYYDDGTCVIYHGDCEEVLPTLDPVDLVVTSPPYNLGWATGASHHTRVRMGHNGSKWSGASLADGYDDHDDAMDPAEYLAWQRSCIRLMWHALADDGAIFYNHKPRPSGERCWLPLDLLHPDVTLRQIVVWARAGGINYSPNFYVPTYEWIMVLAREGWRLKSQAASGMGDVWRIPQEANPDHPCSFPLALPALAIETTAPASVLDPFLGSGTTLRAAKDAGVRGIGIEKSERYCEIAAKRLAQEVLPFPVGAEK